MKKLDYAILGVLALVIGLLYVRSQKAPKAANTFHAQELPPTAADSRRASSGTDRPREQIPQPATPRKIIVQKETAIPAILGTRGAVSDYAILDVICKHPGFDISPDQAADLQEIFSSHFNLFAGLQSKLATATTQADGSTLIQIPAFPDQVQQLMDGLRNDINSYYHGNVPQGVAEAILEVYRGYTNSAGQVPVNLTVKISSDPNYLYDFNRQTVFVDPGTGKVTGTGQTSNVLTQEQALYSPYIELSKYFPKAPKS